MSNSGFHLKSFKRDFHFYFMVHYDANQKTPLVIQINEVIMKMCRLFHTISNV